MAYGHLIQKPCIISPETHRFQKRVIHLSHSAQTPDFQGFEYYYQAW